MIDNIPSRASSIADRTVCDMAYYLDFDKESPLAIAELIDAVAFELECIADEYREKGEQ